MAAIRDAPRARGRLPLNRVYMQWLLGSIHGFNTQLNHRAVAVAVYNTTCSKSEMHNMALIAYTSASHSVTQLLWLLCNCNCNCGSSQGGSSSPGTAGASRHHADRLNRFSDVYNYLQYTGIHSAGLPDLQSESGVWVYSSS